MDLMWIGSVNQYTKGLARQTQWNLKKQSGDFTSHKKSLQDYVTITKASDLLPDAENRDDKLSAIVTKAQAGAKLSQDEWDYLKEKAPELYAKLKEIEREQENYEEALKRCKTRDEAQRLHMFKLGEIMAAAKNEDSSALFRLNRMTQTMTAFTESEQYREMPTEGEQAVERERERRAEQEALREETAVREAEREAESESETEDDPEVKFAPEKRAETETGSKAEDAAKAKPSSEAEDAARVPHQTEAGTGKTTHNEDVRRTVSHAEEKPVSHQPELTGKGKNAPVTRDAAPAISFGQRAYLNQKSEESHTHPRRRAFDTEA